MAGTAVSGVFERVLADGVIPVFDGRWSIVVVLTAVAVAVPVPVSAGGAGSVGVCGVCGGNIDRVFPETDIEAWPETAVSSGENAPQIGRASSGGGDYLRQRVLAT